MNLLFYPDPSLKTKCAPLDPKVLLDPISAQLIEAELKLMAEVMYKYQGIGLAANQVGLQKRMFVARQRTGPFLSFVNPKIVKFEGQWAMMTEGCLSVPGIAESVRRNDKVSVESLDLTTGEPVTKSYSGTLAQVIQHEMEHLDGEIFLKHFPPGGLDKVRAHIRKLKLSGKLQ